MENQKVTSWSMIKRELLIEDLVQDKNDCYANIIYSSGISNLGIRYKKEIEDI